MDLLLYYFTKWCGGLMAKTLVWSQRHQGTIPLTNIYYVEYFYLYIYHGGWRPWWLGKYLLLFIYYIFIF